jgi:hypothetical protein
MQCDFTKNTYLHLLIALQKQGFSFQSVNAFLERPIEKVVVLRHDVDLSPENSLQTAKIEQNLGIKGTYYFRILPLSWDEEIIKQIAAYGHEIGYHYETMDTCKGKIDKAYEAFCENLDTFRELYPVKTICMHGSPLSKFDNSAIWEKYDYHKLGIVGEPFFDIDYNKVLYLTDTGRRWDGLKVSIRDKVLQTPLQQQYCFKTTFDILQKIDALPNQIMVNIHPQRWNDKFFSWSREWVLQNLKNQIKRFLAK